MAKKHQYINKTKVTVIYNYSPWTRTECIMSIGLWRWYINITITILDIIHRPVFYLELNLTL
jgi:hypothetical protein